MTPSVVLMEKPGMKISSIWRRLNSRAQRFVPVLIAALAWGFVPDSTQAATHKREAYTSAAASTSTCIEEGDSTRCTDMSLRVFIRDTGTEVCLTFFTYVVDDFSAPTFEDGCTLTATDVFSIDTKTLSSGILIPTKVTLTLDECMQTECRRESVVAATFTGLGTLTSYPSRSRYNDGTCTYTFSSKSIGRDAAATIALDGQSLDVSGFLSRSKSKTKIQCKTGAAAP